MASPQTVLEALATALHDSGRLPDDTTYATLEIDMDGEQADVEPPVVEIQLGGLQRAQDRNTELVGHETDSNGNHIGRIYRSAFQLNAQIDCLSADGSEYDARDMGYAVQEALVEYDSAQIGAPLPHPDASTQTLRAVWNVSVGQKSRPNDLSLTPALRRARTQVECRFSDEYRTTDYRGPDDYIQNYSISTTVL